MEKLVTFGADNGAPVAVITFKPKNLNVKIALEAVKQLKIEVGVTLKAEGERFLKRTAISSFVHEKGVAVMICYQNKGTIYTHRAKTDAEAIADVLDAALSLFDGE